MTDNELAALAMTGSDEPRHNSTASVKLQRPRLRVWMAKPDFYPVITRNTISGNADFFMEYSSFPKGGGNAITEGKNVSVPLSVFISIFFTPENYQPIAEVLSHKVEDAFDLCGNNPQHTERWYELVNFRSLSCGDVVEVINNGKSVFFVCAPYGWEHICREMTCEDKLPTINPKVWRA